MKTTITVTMFAIFVGLIPVVAAQTEQELQEQNITDDVNALFERGETLRGLGQFNESIVYYDKILAIDPNNTDIMYNKGDSLSDLGQYNESIGYFDKVLAINPNHVLALANKGSALTNLGKFNESIEYYDKALQ
jgi:tetratricopeptide (TPR) repeat protein